MQITFIQGGRMLRRHGVLRAGTFFCLTVLGFGVANAAVYDLEEILAAKGLARASVAAKSRAAEAIVSRMRSGDVLGLPRSYALGKLNFATMPSNVLVEYGEAEEIDLGAEGKTDVSFVGVRAKIKGSNIANSYFHAASSIEGNNLSNDAFTFISGGYRLLRQATPRDFSCGDRGSRMTSKTAAAHCG